MGSSPSGFWAPAACESGCFLGMKNVGVEDHDFIGLINPFFRLISIYCYNIANSLVDTGCCLLAGIFAFGFKSIIQLQSMQWKSWGFLFSKYTCKISIVGWQLYTPCLESNKVGILIVCALWCWLTGEGKERVPFSQSTEGLWSLSHIDPNITEIVGLCDVKR